MYGFGSKRFSCLHSLSHSLIRPPHRSLLSEFYLESLPGGFYWHGPSSREGKHRLYRVGVRGSSCVLRVLRVLPPLPLFPPLILGSFARSGHNRGLRPHHMVSAAFGFRGFDPPPTQFRL